MLNKTLSDKALIWRDGRHPDLAKKTAQPRGTMIMFQDFGTQIMTLLMAFKQTLIAKALKLCGSFKGSWLRKISPLSLP